VEEYMSGAVPAVIDRYFEADARRDTDAVVALFTEDAEVSDEGQRWHGTGNFPRRVRRPQVALHPRR
jgi:ketosteroid isomerase-like protein